MKRILLFVLVILTTLLASCAATEDIRPTKSFNKSDEINYDYKTASFNNATSTDLLFGTNDYQKEFYAFYDIAEEKGYLSKSLTEQEKTAYDSFFLKLELLDKHTQNIFNLDSTELKSLFEANSIEIEAIDVFTFNAIKNTFDTLSENEVSIRKDDYIEVILERQLTDEEDASLDFLYSVLQNIYDYHGEEVPLANTYESYITTIENISPQDFTEEDKKAIETAYNLITSIKE